MLIYKIVQDDAKVPAQYFFFVVEWRVSWISLWDGQSDLSCIIQSHAAIALGQLLDQVSKNSITELGEQKVKYL